MLADILVEGEEKYRQRQEKLEASKQKLNNACHALSQGFHNLIQSKLDVATRNQAIVDSEINAISNFTNKLYNKTEKWKTVYDKFRLNMQELRLVENWADQTEEELHKIALTLEYVYSELTKQLSKEEHSKEQQ